MFKRQRGLRFLHNTGGNQLLRKQSQTKQVSFRPLFGDFFSGFSYLAPLSNLLMAEAAFFQSLDITSHLLYSIVIIGTHLSYQERARHFRRCVGRAVNTSTPSAKWTIICVAPAQRSGYVILRVISLRITAAQFVSFSTGISSRRRSIILLLFFSARKLPAKT